MATVVAPSYEASSCKRTYIETYCKEVVECDENNQHCFTSYDCNDAEIKKADQEAALPWVIGAIVFISLVICYITEKFILRA